MQYQIQYACLIFLVWFRKCTLMSLLIDVPQCNMIALARQMVPQCVCIDTVTRELIIESLFYMGLILNNYPSQLVDTSLLLSTCLGFLVF